MKIVGLLVAALAAGVVQAEDCQPVLAVSDEAPSLLPKGRSFRLVWHDEFNGTELDTSKWCYRTNFWGRRAAWFAAPEDEAIEVGGGVARLKIVERNGQLKSPQLQTGGLLWDIPQEKQGIWFFPKREKAKFLKRYGYFECRCRLQQLPGWWTAFWMQAEANGATVDPSVSGIEHDIMESFVPGEVIPAWFHYNGYGAEYSNFASSRCPDTENAALSDRVDKTQFHTFGMMWEPDGYTLYLDGRQRGHRVGTAPGEAISHVPEFVLLTTEVRGCRSSGVVDSTYGCGKATPESYATAKAGDEFVVDFVRVYDLEKTPQRDASFRDTWFREARFGMFIHWGIYSIPAKGEWSYAYDSYKPGEYEAFAKRFNPVNYRPREWAKLAKAAGMKYAVLTSRHHDGFCMFDSHFTDYKITNTPYGRDAVREFLEAFRAEGLKVGFYHSLPDWTHPGYADTESPECLRAGGAKEPHVPTEEQYASFTNLVWNHVNQLTTEYGKLDLLFFDYTSQTKAFLDYFGRDRLLETVYANQPDIIVNDRLSYYKDSCRDFDYYTPEICVPNQPQTVKGHEVPWETCATMNDHWGYCREDGNWKSPEAIVAGLIGCVSRNGNLLLNVGPTELGEIPDGSVKILKAMADWYAVNGESVTGCGLSRFTPPYGCVYTQKGDTLYCHFLQSPLGDTILPQLKGRISKLTLLRTGEEVKQINHWGFELLKPDEQRIRTRGIRPGDVVRIDLN